MAKNHTPLEIDLFIEKHFGNKKVVTNIVFFTLGIFTALIFLTVFYAINSQHTISLLH